MLKKILAFLLIIPMLVSCSLNEGEVSDIEDGELIINDGNTVFRLVAEEASTLLPTENIPVSLAEMSGICYEPLFDFDNALNPIPILAKNCTMTQSTQYRVELKEGIKWHDGSDFNAKDVVYTFNALKNSDGVFSEDVEKILKAEVLTNTLVGFTLSEPTANFVGLLSFPIIKRDTPREETTDFIPIGTGAYKFSQKKSNTYIFEKNENWHGGVASDKTVTLTLLKDKASAIYAFEASEADVISSEIMNLAKNTPKGHVEIVDYISNNLTFLGMNTTDEGILSDPEIRKAISYLIDKESIIKENVYGRGTAAEIPVYPGAWFYNKQNDAIEVTSDGNYLQNLLAQRGWFMKNGMYTKDFEDYESELTLSILVNKDNEEKKAIAQSVSDILGKNGILVKIKPVSYEQYTQKIQDMDFSMFIGEIALDKNMDPEKLVKSGENYFGYSSEAMDDILMRMGMSGSNEELISCFDEFSAQFMQDMPFVPLFFRKKAMIATEELSGYGDPGYYKPFRNIENWYFTKKVEIENKE